MTGRYKDQQTGKRERNQYPLRRQTTYAPSPQSEEETQQRQHKTPDSGERSSRDAGGGGKIT